MNLGERGHRLDAGCFSGHELTETFYWLIGDGGASTDEDGCGRRALTENNHEQAESSLLALNGFME